MMNLYKDIKYCNQCGLCHNQSPLVQRCNNADVFWVGLSAVKVSDNDDAPLATNTNSGKLINAIELINSHVQFYKTNLVKCLPLDKDKIRYPSTIEMKNCFFNLENEIELLKPRIIFLLGKQVATFVLRKFGINNYSLDENFQYSYFQVENILLVPIHHPSYVLVYKRKRLQDYIKNITKITDLHTHPTDFLEVNSIEYAL